MAGTLKALGTLESDLEGRPHRGIAKQDLLDMVQSLAAVKGCMWVNDGDTPMVCTGNYERIDSWDGSRDTRGLQDGLGEDPAAGHYTLKNNADGDWSVAAMVRIAAIDSGTYRLRVAVEDSEDVITASPFRDEVSLGAGDVGQMTIAGCLLKGLVKGDKIRLELRGNNGKATTITHAQFTANRS